MSDIEKTKPIDVLAARVWSGTHWHYPNIEKLIARITTLERELAEAKKENGRLRTQLAACASDANAALRMVRFTGEGVYGDYYTDEQE